MFDCLTSSKGESRNVEIVSDNSSFSNLRQIGKTEKVNERTIKDTVVTAFSFMPAFERHVGAQRNQGPVPIDEAAKIGRWKSNSNGGVGADNVF